MMDRLSVSGSSRMSDSRALELEEKRLKLQDLYEKSKKVKEDADDGTFHGEEILELVEESTSILSSESKKDYTKIDLPLLGGKVLNASIAALKINTSAIDVDTQVFDTDEFCEKLLPLISEDTIEHITYLADSCFMNSVPSYPFMNGTKQNSQKSVRKARQKLNLKHTEAEKKKPENVKTLDKEETEIQQVLEGMMKVLLREYKRNGRNPVSYIRFVVDPHSFSNTVENMFHLSFLVKDGYVRFKLVDDLPVIEPVYSQNKYTSDELQGPEEKNQVIIEITMDDWQYLVEEFEIKEPMLVRTTIAS